MTGQTLEIDQTYFVNAPVATVFRVLTVPSELIRWFLKKAQLPPTKGRGYGFEWQGGYSHAGRVLDFVKNRRVSLSRPNSFKNLPGETQVTFTVRKRGSGTLLQVRHVGYKRSDAWLRLYGGTQSGWAHYLMNLNSVLEHGHDLRSPRDLA